MSGLRFEEMAPIAEADPLRADVALFVGFVPLRGDEASFVLRLVPAHGANGDCGD